MIPTRRPIVAVVVVLLGILAALFGFVFTTFAYWPRSQSGSLYAVWAGVSVLPIVFIVAWFLGRQWLATVALVLTALLWVLKWVVDDKNTAGYWVLPLLVLLALTIRSSHNPSRG